MNDLRTRIADVIAAADRVSRGAQSATSDDRHFTPMTATGTVVYLGRSGGFDVRHCPEAEYLASFIAAACNAYAAPERSGKTADDDMVICPACVHQFPAIPVNTLYSAEQAREIQREAYALGLAARTVTGSGESIGDDGDFNMLMADHGRAYAKNDPKATTAAWQSLVAYIDARTARNAGVAAPISEDTGWPQEQIDKLDAVLAQYAPAAPTHRLNGDQTVAVSTDVFINPDMATCPRGVKVQLEGAGGVLVYGTYNGDPFYVGWAPVPRRRPAC